jgi:hypothetical protein
MNFKSVPEALVLTALDDASDEIPSPDSPSDDSEGFDKTRGREGASVS